MGLPDVWNMDRGRADLSLSAGALIVALSKFVGDRVAARWLARIEADHAEDLAQVKHDLVQLEKHYQAQLDEKLARLDHSSTNSGNGTKRNSITPVTVTMCDSSEEFQSVREIWKFVARARASALAIVERKVPQDDTPEKQLERFVTARKKFGEDQYAGS